jgi:YegS/Rv2252/BmrU family lipid kinase
MEHKWCIIVNPMAGNGAVKRKWPKLELKIKAILKDCQIRYTSHKGHGIELSQQAIEEGYRHIIGVGGDGTNNEIVNGIFLQDVVPTTAITYTLLPVGTGNDWVKTYGIPKKIDAWLRMLEAGKTKIQDVGLVHYQAGGQTSKRYFANVAGMAYDAYLVRYACENPGMVSSKIFYLLLLLRCLFQYTLRKAKVFFDGQTDIDYYYSINIGICSYSGGGMQTVPHAIEDDGLFALSLFGPFSKLGVLLNTYRFYNKSVGEHSLVNCYQVKSVRVEAAEKRPTLVEVDGEFLGETPAEFSLIEKGLKVIIP